MQVVATAGHVDHGKSTLVRALTGMEPDRYAEEQRRGMTIDLGFAWTTLPGGSVVAIVDVPGHERFVGTMLAGVGPVPAAVVVVAADEGWMPQTAEHVVALDALGVRHGLLVVTKSDLADPQPAAQQAAARLRGTSLAGIPWVAVSAVTGDGLDDLRAGLARLVRELPAPAVVAPVRLWVDRSFTIRGAGTVVTGTLGAGRLVVGDTVQLAPTGRSLVVKGLQSLNRPVPDAVPVSRVAVNLRGVERSELRRGMALTTGHWQLTDQLDVRHGAGVRLPPRLTAHLGSAAVPARVRPLDGSVARLRLAAALPVHVGDRLLLRDPGSRSLIPADVVDVRPVPLNRRGDAARVARQLAAPPAPDAEIARHEAVRAGDLAAAGYASPPAAAQLVGGWWLAPQTIRRWRGEIRSAVAELPPGPTRGVGLEALRRRTGAPDVAALTAVVASDPGLRLTDGGVVPADRPADRLPELEALVERLAADPFAAPEAGKLDLAPAALAAGVRSGQLLHLGHGIYVSPRAPDVALERLSRLEMPFTASDARQALGVTRRVAIPLLEHLDASRRTRRIDGNRRVLVGHDHT